MKILQETVFILWFGFFCGILAQEDDYRLPPIYIVNHYDIDLTVPAESFTANSSSYSGSVAIQFQVTVNTTEVKLHSNYHYIEILTIQIDAREVLSNNDSYSVNNNTNILTIGSQEFVVGQNYTLKISFNAVLLGGGGFYKVSYTDDNNYTQYIATTQFQATNARNAFPCFDEPGYRSTFAFNLTYPSDMEAWTNTPSVKNDTIIFSETNMTKTEFDVSPNMPVYLVAFTISKYTCSEGSLEESSTYKHRVCSRLDKANARSWAMDLTPKVIDHLNSYTGINYTYSLSKLDQMAVPGKSGAMENWGLVIYGESALLFDNTLQTNNNKQGIAGIISHELAHQWFGNLVTCKWWSETFLNEGFATMFQYYTTGYILPEFEMEKQFVVRILQPILTTEGYLNVPALRSNASTPAEVSAKFNSYSYYKGGSVLRMVEHIVGRENFQLGVQKYLSDNEYQPVEPEDLWVAIENVTANDASVVFPGVTTLSEVIYNWIYKGGYPILNVSLAGTNITITQQRFLYSGNDTENSTWYVPVSYSTAATGDSNEITSPSGWVTPFDDFVITGFTNASEWIVVNNQQTGFYRVNYDTTLWANLATALKQTNFSGIHVVNRAQIIQDSDMLARAGYLTYGQVMRNIEFLRNDTSYFSWYPAVTLFSYLLQRTGTENTLGAALADHFLELLTAVTESVPLAPVDEDKQIETLNQVLVNPYSCKYGNAGCVSIAKEEFLTYKSNFVRPNINIRSIVYCNGIRHSENASEDWSFLYNQYQNISVSDDSSTILSALGCAKNTTILNEFLSRTISNENGLTASTSVFSAIYSANEVGVDTALDFFIANYEAISNSFTASGIGSILTGMASYFTKTSQIEKDYPPSIPGEYLYKIKNDIMYPQHITSRLQMLENFRNTTELNSTIATYVNNSLTTARSNQEIINTHRSSLNEYFALSDEEENTSTTTSTTNSTSTPITTSSTSSTATASDDPITTSSTASSTSSVTASSDVSTTMSSSTTTTSTTTPTSTTTTEATTTADPGNGSEELGSNGLMSLVILALVNIFFGRF